MLNYSNYEVEITAIAGAAPSDGFVNHITANQYGDTTGFPSSVANALRLARANRRYKALLEAMGIVSQFRISNVVATGANANTVATDMTFTLYFDRDDALITADELNPGTQLTGAAAVKRCLARGLTYTDTERLSYMDPTIGATPNSFTIGSRLESVTVGALTNSIATAETQITVTKLTS